MSWRESLRYQAWRWVGLPLSPLRVGDAALQAAKSASEIARTTAQRIADATGRATRLTYEGTSLSSKSLREFSDGVLAGVRRHGRVPLDVVALGTLPNSHMAHTSGTAMYHVATDQLTYRRGEITLNERRFGRAPASRCSSSRAPATSRAAARPGT
ncbi:hypothetical protein [Yinghuangia sp. YIM S09857]|uniref:hypothetical protein n=1 Tax=Yinghuangia sp. YIM S09857 TaxID=3436929 RepID=UPI003F530123